MAMKNPNQPTKTTDPVRNPFNRSPWWRAFFVLALAFAVACFALSPAARAVDPPPGGFYPGENTALGEDALFSLLPGGNDNVALGYEALHDTTTGLNNTRSLPTPSASTIRPMVGMRSRSRPATKTPVPVVTRSSTTQPAATTLPWVIAPVPI
jgi:hypothetical protein